MKIIFFGTPPFSATVLEYLLSHGHNIVAVVTKPDRPKGRSNAPQPSAVKQLALKHHLPLLQPLKSSSPEGAKELEAFDADLFIVVAYSEILKENLLSMPRLGCINVHASILPKYRGAAPIQRSIMEGDKETGVTIMYMAKELDAGDILSIAKIPITEDMTAGELTEQLSHVGAKALHDTLIELKNGTLKRERQDPKKVTLAPKLASEDGKINWDRPAEVVYNHIRGVTPKPGAWCWIHIKDQKKRFSIKKARLEKHMQGIPGTLLVNNKEYFIACREGAILLLEVQPEGKSSMTTEAFFRGVSERDFKILL